MENGGSEEESGRAGLVARASYNYKKKYYIEGSLRHDGSVYSRKIAVGVISLQVQLHGLYQKKVSSNL